MSVEEQMKIAELKKILAETEKTVSEKDKIDFELEELKKESRKPWWIKKAFRNHLISALIGASFIGFYLTYVIVPASNLDKLDLQLQKQKAEQKIYDAQLKFSKDSIALFQQKLKADSIEVLLAQTIAAMNKQDSSRNVLADLKKQNTEQLTRTGRNSPILSDSIKKVQGSIKQFDSTIIANKGAIEGIRESEIGIGESVKIKLTGQILIMPENALIRVSTIVGKDDFMHYNSFVIKNGEGTIKLPIGRYSIQAEAAGYFSKPVTVLIGISNRVLALELPLQRTEAVD
jgi:hypothetical protein